MLKFESRPKRDEEASLVDIWDESGQTAKEPACCVQVTVRPLWVGLMSKEKLKMSRAEAHKLASPRRASVSSLPLTDHVGVPFSGSLWVPCHADEGASRKEAGSYVRKLIK